MNDEPILIKDRLNPKKKAVREAAREIEEKSPALFQDLNLDLCLMLTLPTGIMIQLLIIRLLGRLEILEDFIRQTGLTIPEAPPDVNHKESK